MRTDGYSKERRSLVQSIKEDIIGIGDSIKTHILHKISPITNYMTKDFWGREKVWGDNKLKQSA